MNELKTEYGYWGRILLYHLPAAAFAVLITVVSSIPDIPTPKADLLPVDKVAHFAEYAIFAFLVFRSVSQLKPPKSTTRIVLISAIFLSVFAFLDEYHQSFVPGRQQDLVDICADCLGAWIILAIMWLKRRKLSPSES